MSPWTPNGCDGLSFDSMCSYLLRISFSFLDSDASIMLVKNFKKNFFLCPDGFKCMNGILSSHRMAEILCIVRSVVSNRVF